MAKTEHGSGSSGALARIGSLRARLILAFLLVLAVPLLISLLVARVSAHDGLIVVAAALVMGVPLAIMLSIEIARPVRAAKIIAVRAARGEAGAQVDVHATGETAELIEAVNALSSALRNRITDEDATREEVRMSVRRLGEALRSTHDMSKMLAIVLETALVAVRGKSGAVFLLTARHNELYVKVARHLPDLQPEQRIGIGHGIAGSVAKSRTGIMFPGPDAPIPEDPEPIEQTALAVPLETQSQLVGVLAIYGRGFPVPFGEQDLETITSLAQQAGVGIDNVLLHEEAQRLSITDGLTGLWNYRYFQIIVQREFERASRYPQEVALLVVDIDDFKKINDTYGHQRGDAILIELAHRMIANTRGKIDFLARYGGEEFILILPETGIAGARSAAEKIRAAVANEQFTSEGEVSLNVTVSIGYSVYPKHGADPKDLLGSADQAMYEAKTRGKNRVVGADELTHRATLAADPAHK